MNELFSELKESGTISKEGRLVKSRLSKSRVSIFDDKVSKDSYFYFVNEDGALVENFIYKMKQETLDTFIKYEAKVASNGDKFRLYPLEDFERVEVISQQHLDKEDAPISELTIRDLAAILTMKPISNKIWLNHCLKNIK